MNLPLAGIRVIDLSTLLPGPAASLILAEGGADVIKVERPGGDDMRRLGSAPEGGESVYFALLNRGKDSIELDLKSPEGKARLRELISDADVLIEQFRPGVMDRLGFGYDAVGADNPGLIYCSITGYGQSGPDALRAGHDLNYLARTGVASLVEGTHGRPAFPWTPFADLAAGSYPAVMNILLALLSRSATGKGGHLDISMTDNLFPLAYWALASRQVTGGDPRPGTDLMNGGSPRCAFYRTADDRYLAVAALEDRFWDPLCDMLGLGAGERDDSGDPRRVRECVAEAVAERTAEEWDRLLDGRDVCCEVVRSLTEGIEDRHFAGHRLFDRRVAFQGRDWSALPVPVAAGLRREDHRLPAPDPGCASTGTGGPAR